MTRVVADSTFAPFNLTDPEVYSECLCMWTSSVFSILTLLFLRLILIIEIQHSTLLTIETVIYLLVFLLDLGSTFTFLSILAILMRTALIKLDLILMGEGINLHYLIVFCGV
jgi:hypothetical protein